MLENAYVQYERRIMFWKDPRLPLVIALDPKWLFHVPIYRQLVQLSLFDAVPNALRVFQHELVAASHLDPTMTITKKWIKWIEMYFRLQCPKYKPQNLRENFQHLNSLVFSFHVAAYQAVVKMAMGRVVQTMPANLVANIVSFCLRYLLKSEKENRLHIHKYMYELTNLIVRETKPRFPLYTFGFLWFCPSIESVCAW